MPARPFPFALRVGTDIVNVNRISKIIAQHRVDRAAPQLQPFLNKVFTFREQRDFRARFPNFHVTDTERLPQVAAHLAGRYAAKEAAIKAVKPRKLVYLDVEVLRSGATGELFGLIRDKTFEHKIGVKRLELDKGTSSTAIGEEPSAAEAATESPFAYRGSIGEDESDPPGQVVAMSLSHERNYATAVCIAPLEAIPGDVGGEAAARMYDAPRGDADSSKKSSENFFKDSETFHW